MELLINHNYFFETSRRLYHICSNDIISIYSSLPSFESRYRITQSTNNPHPHCTANQRFNKDLFNACNVSKNLIQTRLRIRISLHAEVDNFVCKPCVTLAKKVILSLTCNLSHFFDNYDIYIKEP